MNYEADRRGHTRVPYRAHATLNTAEKAYPAHLMNISRDGALIAVLDENTIKFDEDIMLQIDSDDATIELVGRVAHCKDQYFGLICSPLDEDSEEALVDLLEESDGDRGSFDGY